VSHTRFPIIAAVAGSLIAGRGAAQSTGVVYDGYVAGVRVAELVVRGDGGAASYGIRKRDNASGRWTAARSTTGSRIAADTSFALWGAVRALPGRISAVGRIDWNGLELVGWPDKSSIYERHRELTETVGGRQVKASYWAKRDATRPMDLVIGPDNRLIAGIDVSNDFVLVRRGYERFTTVGRWLEPTVSPAKFGYRALGKQMVPAKDGVKLATLVYLPDGPGATGPFPVVFVRTPYGIGGVINGAWHYPARGYALVLQAARGTSFTDPENRSEGTWVPVINERADGEAALEWIVRQPWSNGKICMQGGSYVGYTQWAASMAKNPALKCLIPESSMGTVFSDQPYMGGSFVEGIAYYTFWMLEQRLLPNRTWSEVLHHRPLIELDDFALGKNLPQWNTLLEHQTNDGYWASQDWYRGEAPREFSTLMISGWWDDDFPGTESNWALMSRYGKGPQRLIIGPWKHGYNADRRLNGYSFGADALRPDIVLEKQRWYDYVLKGLDNGAAGPVVSYFVLGANEWQTADAWPPKEATPEKWYLASDGLAHRNFTSGTLSRTPPSGAQPPDRYRYDPKDPPPNWMSFDLMMRWEDVQSFPYDMKDIEARPDVLTYTSAPLEADLRIAGELTAVLFASTDVLDTDWWIHVSDVDPEGRSNRITQGMIRARFRHNDDPQHHIFGSNYQTEKLLSGDPNEVVRYEIGIRSIANLFKKGHRVRIAVMNAVDNYSFPNSNTGKNEAYVTETIVGNMAVHHAGDHPSHLVLPVIKQR
jgi:putative CocE/NonD family hydrolase